MNPWDENWTLEHGEITTDAADEPGYTSCDLWASFEDDDGHWGVVDNPANVGRDRLMAAAPLLARALLSVEWGCEGDHCPRCCGSQAGGHNPDCMIDAALRAAGVKR